MNQMELNGLAGAGFCSQMKQMELMAMRGRVLGQQLKTMEDNLLPCGRFFCSQINQIKLMAMRGGFYRLSKMIQNDPKIICFHLLDL